MRQVQSIPHLLLERVGKTPNLNAIGSYENNKLVFASFKKVKEIVESLTIGLINLGLTHQMSVSILSHTRKEWHFCDLAILCSSGKTIPIYPSYTHDEVEYIINHSDSNFIFIEDESQLEKIISIQDSLPHLKVIISFESVSNSLQEKLNPSIKFYQYDFVLNLGISESQKNPEQFLALINNINVEDLATIVYTSGTTGAPKGAMITHKALMQVLVNVKKYTHNSIDEQDRMLTYLPLSHVFGRLESFLPILLGLEAIYVNNINKVLEYLPKVQPTIFMAVPRILEKIYEKAQSSVSENIIKKSTYTWAMGVANKYFSEIDSDRSPSASNFFQYQIAKTLVFDKVYNLFGGRIRYFISGGAPLNTEIMKFLRNSNLTVLEGYGLTETIAPCCINPMNKQFLGSVGQPIGDVEVKFADDGEILIKSVALFSGYYKDESATNEAISEDGWFKSGDIGSFNQDGFLVITDRKKDIIITSGGKNIAPQKIENDLKLKKYISQAVIIGDKRKFVSALIALDREALQVHFDEFHISDDCDYLELSNHPLIIQAIKAQIDDVNEHLASFEQIKLFKILPCEVGTNNYLTPSLKLKKKLVLKDFSRLVEAIYE